jgi:saccharopine dehydrogenase (NAD+, L-lysine-forming)
MAGRWLIYGANGYTGRLVVERAVALGLKPVVAGRKENAIGPWAFPLGLEYRIFSLDDPDDLDEGLKGIDAVLHCAGPFSATSEPMLDACIRNKVHYLDITGEISVFEAIVARDAELKAAGVTAIPGVGFDVVPTDGMAAMLADQLPTARWLELGFMGLGGVSQGTAKSAVEGIPNGGAARIHGKIMKVAPGWRTKWVMLGGKSRHIVSIPWGDISTAFQTTGIPNITCYMAVPPSAVGWMKLGDKFSGLLARPWVQRFLKGQIERRVQGPDLLARQSGASYVWGRVEDPQGHWVEGHLTTPEGYLFTARSSVAAVQRVLDGGIATGAQTPSKAFGRDFVSSIEGVVVDSFTRGGDTGAEESQDVSNLRA